MVTPNAPAPARASCCRAFHDSDARETGMVFPSSGTLWRRCAEVFSEPDLCRTDSTPHPPHPLLVLVEATDESSRYDTRGRIHLASLTRRFSPEVFWRSEE